MRIMLAHAPPTLDSHHFTLEMMRIGPLLMRTSAEMMRIMLRSARPARAMMRKTVAPAPRRVEMMRNQGVQQPLTVESQHLARIRIMHTPARRVRRLQQEALTGEKERMTGTQGTAGDDSHHPCRARQQRAGSLMRAAGYLVD